MRRLVFALALAALSGPAPAALLGDAAACGGAQPALRVRVEGFKAPAGTLRVQVYGANPADWLAKGRKLRRIDVPVRGGGAMDVCVALPAPGEYAVAVRHDLDGDGRSGWSDGGGFSRNPKISLLRLKPAYRDVAIPVGNGPRAVDIILNYRSGLSIGPVRG